MYLLHNVSHKEIQDIFPQKSYYYESHQENKREQTFIRLEIIDIDQNFTRSLDLGLQQYKTDTHICV